MLSAFDGGHDGSGWKNAQEFGARSDLRDRIWVGKCLQCLGHDQTCVIGSGWENVSSVRGTIGPARSDLSGKMFKCLGHDRTCVIGSGWENVSSVRGTIGPARSDLSGKMFKCLGHDRTCVGKCSSVCSNDRICVGKCSSVCSNDRTCAIAWIWVEKCLKCLGHDRTCVIGSVWENVQVLWVRSDLGGKMSNDGHGGRCGHGGFRIGNDVCDCLCFWPSMIRMPGTCVGICGLFSGAHGGHE